jgi:hypothetical protein
LKEVYIISWERNLKNNIYWIILILLVLSPIAIDAAVVSNYLPILQELFPFWKHRPTYLVLSDILFLEGGLFLFFGALIAGVVMYNAWSPGRLALFIKQVFDWEIVRKAREIPASLIVGLILIGAGIIYILAAIIVTL